MKNKSFLIFTAALSILLMLTISSFSTKHSNGTLGMVKSSTLIPDKPKKKIKFALRHAGEIDPLTGRPQCDCPNCACSGCPCPLGICACIVIEDAGTSGSSGDIGIAWASFNSDNKLVLEFEQQTAITDLSVMPNDFVPVSGNVTFSNDLCQYWELNSITVPSGNYSIDYSTNQYGKIVVDAISQ